MFNVPPIGSFEGRRRSKFKITGPTNGFTLLEVLLAMSILAVIVTVIYASFSSAGRDVEQVESSRNRTDLARTLIAKLSADIGNAYYNQSLKDTVFYARPSTKEKDVPRFDRIALTTLTNWRKPDSKEMDLWEVGYRFEERPDGTGKVLMCREKREINKDNTVLEGGTDYEVTDRISELRLQYRDGSKWTDEWDSRIKYKLPNAVEIRLTLEGGSSFLTQVEAGR